MPDRVYVSLGAKVEHNDYTGFGLQPSARIRWTANKTNMFWAAVSQAERTPTRSDTDIRVNFEVEPGSRTLLVSLFGSQKYKNEVTRAFEAGYRAQLISRVSIDSTVFFNQYHHLLSLESGSIFSESYPLPAHLVYPTHSSNLEYGETHGFEVFAHWEVVNHWTLSPGYFPDRRLIEAAAPHLAVFADGAEDDSTFDFRRRQPLVNSLFDRRLERDGTHLLALADQIDQRPAAVERADGFNFEIAQLRPAQPAGKQDPEDGVVAFALNGVVSENGSQSTLSQRGHRNPSIQRGGIRQGSWLLLEAEQQRLNLVTVGHRVVEHCLP